MTIDIQDAINALLAYEQADMEGTMVLASRQAIHEVADELRRMRASAKKPDGCEPCNWPDCGCQYSPPHLPDLPQTLRDTADWSGLPRDLYVVSVKSDGIVFDVQCCSVPMAIGPEVRYSRLAPQTAPLTEVQIKHMVDRFLGWKLPENFNPDDGISFNPTWNSPVGPQRRTPTGTNLFDATQADAMVRHMIEGMQAQEPVGAKGEFVWDGTNERVGT